MSDDWMRSAERNTAAMLKRQGAWDAMPLDIAAPLESAKRQEALLKDISETLRRLAAAAAPPAGQTAESSGPPSSDPPRGG
jgi:hypothetical protein